MNKHAIYHITDTPYAYGKDLNTLRVVLRTANGDIKECILCYKDRYDWKDEFLTERMQIDRTTELYDFYKADISVERNRYRYFFKLVDKEDNIYYLDERGLRDYKIPKDEATAFQYPYIAEGDLYKEVNWLQESVVYQIFVDRFCNGDKDNDPKNTLKWGSPVTPKSMFGGDIKGIISKLDYLKDLGVDLIYLTPIFKSSSNHKYDVNDYYNIDPQFGTLEEGKTLVSECHKRGIRIVFDCVFNHSGDDFFAFQDVLKNGEKSKYKDWYFIDSYPVDQKKVNYYSFSNHIKSMPKLNTSNKEVKEYLLKVGEFWIKEVGIDGWRLDVCDEVDHKFWRSFKDRVKECKNDSIIIGEIMHEATSFLKGDQMDGIMNYPFKGALIDFFARRAITVEQFNEILGQNSTIYMEGITRQLWNLIGSHDTQRFLTECEDDIERMKLAIGFQFSYIGVPYIYYGDEIGLTGGEDPESRKCMIWEKDKQNLELFDWYKCLIKIRKDNLSLVYGDYKVLYCKENVLIFERNFNGEKIIVAINNNYKKYYVNLGLDTMAKDLLKDGVVDLSKTLILDSMEFKIWKEEGMFAN
ncbi:glycoside hydrolase family 13 protein [Clostridium sp. 'White wine YQ']|uniref:glycoside hydrolase family 13 protein n=1 Tax=Clostridium sp. 'White wine YQ' TaxID=3027474 RepID=UPI00236601FE|nr:glycoside hydrolase family 13 protein [Clostridium sp. 'White wine YQ']MDD7794437.1 glycoside hydrolase family 13 protein [Clostridium sp. 'White wine YQ']